MTKIEVESLYDFLKEHENEIDYVVLTWTWPLVVEFESGFYGTVYGEERYPLYHRFTGTRIDEEYSFAGNVKEALEFADSYDCWDGHEIEFENGIVFGENEGYDPDADEFPDDEESLKEVGVYDIYYAGLYYHWRDSRGNYSTRWYNPNYHHGIEPYRDHPRENEESSEEGVQQTGSCEVYKETPKN